MDVPGLLGIVFFERYLPEQLKILSIKLWLVDEPDPTAAPTFVLCHLPRHRRCPYRRRNLAATTVLSFTLE